MISLFTQLRTGQLSMGLRGRIVGDDWSRRSLGAGCRSRFLIGEDIGQTQMERPSRHRSRRTPMGLSGSFFEGHRDLQANPPSSRHHPGHRSRDDFAGGSTRCVVLAGRDSSRSRPHPRTGSCVPYIVYRLPIVQTLTIPSTLRVVRDLSGKPFGRRQPKTEETTNKSNDSNTREEH